MHSDWSEYCIVRICSSIKSSFFSSRDVQHKYKIINGVIWQTSPKEVFVEKQTLQVGVCSAIVNFNSGMNGVISVLRDLGMASGHFTMAFCLK